MSPSISDKPVVKNILEHCFAYGVRHVVLSPGSRNAPFLISFPASGKFRCYTIVDERSAAYFALGLARKTGEPVVMACTSGTAALNYAPALAEAYYQQIPLIAITSDRPPEFVDQADGQTIRQPGIFGNFVRYECQLPTEEPADGDALLVNRMLNEAFHRALGIVNGPVHINVPFREPLYNTVPMDSVPSSPVVQRSEDQTVSEALLTLLQEEISGHQKVMLIIGATSPDAALTKLVRALVAKGVVVMTENLSNIDEPGVFENTDRVLEGFSGSDQAFVPEVLITLDTPVLSKKIKQRIRNSPSQLHWHFSNQEVLIDTYQCLTRQVVGNAVQILALLFERLDSFADFYQQSWEGAKTITRDRHQNFLENVTWCDLKVFGILSELMPENQEVHFSNSTPVRYGQLFEWPKEASFYANRGTSGIDGCLSTAVGASIAGSQPVTLITGDLAFFYDSNGLWNKYLPDSFRVIVINNGGGGIFRFIPGPSESPQLEDFFEAKRAHQCRGIAETYGLQYYAAGNENELTQILNHFWNDKGSPALLEVFTPGEENGEILRSYFKTLRINS
ncbi:2-succinyl-5-enolpyruvyl-6-hydroxy-3-cyclohexene-1-carboxylic-acid synthase [Marinilabilia sp.]|uniref:2-succinyl-5-enolpyruvyl-6-hydroxy-3- cyclohexene-1-carboxylic-acid synthase n=1 Tax=Marinilabilia sp. TaxID=2021252 RepID=UPI0025C71A87|nr:2-succinyl-5-enolpyruvyl-6-hydroxy-3-cyclohexene-1-carboxylic-acid synthase [Marinilabilia sp.]